MIKDTIKAGNIIKIPRGHIKEDNWPGFFDNTTCEKLIAANMTASVQILNKDRKVIDTWEVQAFGFQEDKNICISTNMDVLSGFFSGCWMASYRKGGLRRVAHVYTKVGGGIAKTSFVNEIYNKEVVASCFQPKWEAPAAQCLGIITSNDACYSLGISSNGHDWEFVIDYLNRAAAQKSAII